ncbi:nucleotide disphospho-sugar-binding domain-containing protein [Methylobacterium durans]|uniref:UDP-glucosyltransferase n=1 Tax=Methylobacterium durans TaxID=2202825 RepID=A0A2U8WBG5_9HYPH|nr:nucleotide disphospho-sugar-binding domain-containing protein [Methylobacterium durans]AWN43477.1 UDP-glucosyltransferase [Methylobacterium durans]
MKILIASTPANGHINPLLAIGRMLIADGHTVDVLSGTWLRDRTEKAGARFHALPGTADIDGYGILAAVPELKTAKPGLDYLRIVIERVFIDTIPDQHRGLLDLLQATPADIVIADDCFFGVLPLLLGPRSARPPTLLCGTTILHTAREDRAPLFMGVPPATTPEELAACAKIAENYDAHVERPTAQHLRRLLDQIGVGPLSMPLFESVVHLADTYLQLSVPGFEFPRAFPPSVRFVGALPIVPDQAPLPPWAHELDGSRKVVLVTQGTVANHDLDLLIGPTLAALADEDDVLVVATMGGRPVEALKGPIPGNARLAAYLPFEWLLPRADAMVTNGGYGSVNQALSRGVPLVAAGLTEDKADVNARIAWSGAGIDLRTNTPEPEAIRGAVRAVLDEPEHRRAARRLGAEFATYDTQAEILGIVRSYELAERGGRRTAAA